MKRPYLPVDTVYATAILSPVRTLAQFYWARSASFGKPLILLDFDTGPLTASSWKEVASRLTMFEETRRARFGALGVYIENEILVAQADASGATPHLIPSHISADTSWQMVCQSAASFLARGDIGYLQSASDKMDKHPFLNASGVYAGPRTDEPTVPAFLYGIVLGLDEAAARDPKAKAPARSARS